MGALIAALAFLIMARSAVPAAYRIYQQGAVRYEAEHLLSEIRYQQMLARTAAVAMDEGGSPKYVSTRPRLKFVGDGYVIYRGSGLGEKYACLPNVHMQFKGNWAGRDQFLYFGPSGNVFPGTTVLVFASGNEQIYCHLVVDTAGRVRLERSGT